MDLATETFTKTLPYAHSLNSATTASDGRLRALVGDSPDALITDAESGESLATLRSHADHIFSCAWSPDSKFLATGAQDGKIALWDSRNWAKPLATLPNVLSCSRSLHFSSDSSMLVSAENEDVVSVFDTRSLPLSHGQWQQQGRQDIRFFGTIAGVTLVDGGDEIVVANGDRSVGGLMSFRRSHHSSNYNNDCFYSPKVDDCRRRAGKRRATASRRGAVVEEFWGF
jgi:WD40 repeat protein